MARLIIDIPDEYVDWARWVQDNLAKGGLPNTQIAETNNGAVVSTGPASSAPATTGEPATDPWAAVGTSAASTAAAPTQGASSAGQTGTSTPPSGDSQRIVKPTKNGDMVFLLGLNNAPTCNCGNVAARLTAPKKAGGTYSKWVCAKDSGQQWKEKCDFSSFG